MAVAGVLMPPACVHAGRQQAHHQCAVNGLFPRLSHPFADLPSVRRIHEHFPAPGLNETVIGAGEESGHLALAGVAHGSSVKPPKMRSSSSNNGCGVAHSSVALEKCTPLKVLSGMSNDVIADRTMSSAKARGARPRPSAHHCWGLVCAGVFADGVGAARLGGRGIASTVVWSAARQ